MTTETSLQTSFVDPQVSAAITIYDRLKPLQDALGLGNLTVPEMQLFAMVAHHTGLDPFTKQIYAIKRGGKVIHQTGIDGYRSTAERTKGYRGSDAPVFEPCDCGDDKDSPTVHPKIARVTVYRAYSDGIRPQVGEARWHELKPKHTRGNYGYADDMWWQMPENQLAKCAEANGLRKAFPRVLGGVYIAEEMEQAGPGDSAPLLAAAGQPTAAERIAARRAAIEAAEASVHTDGEALFVEGEAVEVTGLTKREFVDALSANSITPEYAALVRGNMYPDTTVELSDAERRTLLDALLEGQTAIDPPGEPLFTEGEWAEEAKA